MSITLSRRRFIAGGTALLGSGISGVAWPMQGSVSLPIPTLVDGTRGEPIDLRIRNGEWSFKPGIKTPTLGINQDYLGPTIRTRQNSQLNLSYQNTLNEQVAIHGHGLHVPGDVDGGPQLAIAPGDRWQPALDIVQPAATCWYHSHTHGSTGHQVYRGLAGMIIIDDEVSDEVPLPRQYGIDDLPVIIQDRTFDSQGRLVYSLQDASEDGWLGETVVINGAISPVARVPAGKVRLRLLNGANARFYIVAFSDNRAFHKIATDGGLLSAPVPLTQMEMSPGERCEIIVDLADGGSAELLTLFEDEIEDAEGIVGSLLDKFSLSKTPQPEPSLTLIVDRTLPAHTAPLPDKLATIVRPEQSEIVGVRDFILDMEDGGSNHTGHGGHALMDMTINGAAMDMNVINERLEIGVWERWRIRSNQGAHPFHVHGCSFLIEQMEGAAAPPDQQGWKDVVVLDDDDWSEIVVRFDHPATDQYPYMYHCHILEHEDRGMMGQFTVN
ncbi:multicopper oxidase domain-containing protein [Hoeflea prorocentri]|uniref:Multicopper oxidase domain-containing protein n=1 Tax=Hoeflea prorocentri TaxID=1922333 RepID=A0A9X3UNY1_9HYPH|nr:multicopper oxidase domain-containing protein [Hoeflea prorocentri]MCY6382729.1 multicopper oxidase domain-containing protein [Hoeflea prorocentri]MDA5400529.1 multicopper oxidase domain-containing protein [Hoeflea prorocentri]